MPKRNDILEQLLRDIHAIKLKMVAAHGAHAAHRKAAITPSQGLVLHMVAAGKATNVKGISQVLHVSSSAATQLIDELVRKGHLIRQTDKNDGRAVILELTPKAKVLFKTLKSQGHKNMTKLFAALSDKELSQYAALNRKILNSLD